MLEKIDTIVEYLDSHPELYWISYKEDSTNPPEFDIVLDNQMMSTFRGCPARFVLEYVEGRALRSGGRSWFLDFGILFHKMIEIYYQDFRKKDFDIVKWAGTQLIEEWNKADMDYHKEHKECKDMGGIMGISGLLISYATKFSKENERIRIIGTEISFGKKKEVPLGRIGIINAYLSGRIDTLIDDGVFIGPMDHKTVGSFRNDPAMRFEVDEGPTGYIYAVNKLLNSVVPEEFIMKRKCNKILMNFISKAITPIPNERFKRLPIYKTQEQLESYRERMLQTSEDIFNTLYRYISTGITIRDTSKCTNWMMSDCMFLPVHRQSSSKDELLILNSMYVKQKIWDTEEVGKERNKNNE